MEQVEVELRGSINPWNWSPRVLSIAATHGVAAISRKGHPEAWGHRCLHVTSVQLWPHYKKKYGHQPFDSMEAKLTVRISGTEVRLTEVRGAEALPLQERAVLFTQRGFQVGPHAWMVRFFSYECLERAVRVLHAIQVSSFVENGEVGCKQVDNANNSNNSAANANSVEHRADHDDAGAVEKHLSAADAALGEVVHSLTTDADFACPPAATAATQLPAEQPLLVVDAAGTRLPRRSVIESDVASDLETIRAAWDHMRSSQHSFEQI